MRQAIVIKNPKWEPFTKASDAFKATTLKEGESAILVMRGRSKEKRVKAIKQIVKKAAAAAAVIIGLLALPSFAQQNILPLLPITTIPAISTNTTAGSGVIGFNPDQVAIFQLTATGTNALAAGTVTVSADTSDNGTDWVSSSYTIPVVATGATAATTITRVTNTVGAKYIRFAKIVNTNAVGGMVELNRFTVSMKPN